MRLLIFVRRTQDYLLRPPMPDFHVDEWKKIYDLRTDLWSRSLSPSFFEYRHILREIARDNLSSVRNSFITCDLNEALAYNGLVLPIDDDDFLHPDLTSHLHGLPLTSHYYEWETYLFNSAGAFQPILFPWVDWPTEYPMPASCAVVFRAEMLRQLPDASSILLDHSLTYRSGLKGFKVSKCLSVYNWHPGSLSNPHIKTAKFPTNHLRLMESTEPWVWARKWLNDLIDLVNEIRCTIPLYM